MNKLMLAINIIGISFLISYTSVGTYSLIVQPDVWFEPNLFIRTVEIIAGIIGVLVGIRFAHKIVKGGE